MGIFFNPRKWTIRLYFWLNDQKNCSLAFGCLPKSSVRFCFFVGNVTSLKMEAPLTVSLTFVRYPVVVVVSPGRVFQWSTRIGQTRYFFRNCTYKGLLCYWKYRHLTAVFLRVHEEVSIFLHVWQKFSYSHVLLL